MSALHAVTVSLCPPETLLAPRMASLHLQHRATTHPATTHTRARQHGHSLQQHRRSLQHHRHSFKQQHSSASIIARAEAADQQSSYGIVYSQQQGEAETTVDAAAQWRSLCMYQCACHVKPAVPAGTGADWDPRCYSQVAVSTTTNSLAKEGRGTASSGSCTSYTCS